MVELAGIVGGSVVVVSATGLVGRRVRRRRAPHPAQPVARQSTTWRLLESEAEVREAIARALACEEATMRLAARRAERLAAMRRHLAVAPPPAGTPGPRPLPPAADEVPRAS